MGDVAITGGARSANTGFTGKKNARQPQTSWCFSAIITVLDGPRDRYAAAPRQAYG